MHEIAQLEARTVLEERFNLTSTLTPLYNAVRSALRDRAFIYEAEIKSYIDFVYQLSPPQGQEPTQNTLTRRVTDLLLLSGDAVTARLAGRKGLAWAQERTVQLAPNDLVHLSPPTRAIIFDDAPEEDEVLVARDAVRRQAPLPGALVSTDPLDLLPELRWVTEWAARGVDVHPKSAGPAALWEALTAQLERSPQNAQLNALTVYAPQNLEGTLTWEARQAQHLEAGEPCVCFVKGNYQSAWYLVRVHAGRQQCYKLSGSSEAMMAIISRGAALKSPEVIMGVEGGYTQTSRLPRPLRAALALAWGAPDGWRWAPPAGRVEAGRRLLEGLGLRVN